MTPVRPALRAGCRKKRAPEKKSQRPSRLAYAEMTACRTAEIRRYFGETPAARCSHCGNWEQQRHWIRRRPRPDAGAEISVQAADFPGRGPKTSPQPTYFGSGGSHFG